MDTAKTNCRKSCGLCSGMIPHESTHCYDDVANCQELFVASNSCWTQTDEWKMKLSKHGYPTGGCRRSCGLCGDGPQHPSVECYDTSERCATEVLKLGLCWEPDKKLGCKKSCGFCKGDEKHPSVTCYDKDSHCKDKLYNCKRFGRR